MTDFVYKGIPIKKDGKIIAVQRVRGIEAADGKTYHGQLGTDIWGNSFSYNQVPNDYTPPVELNGYFIVTSDNKIIITSSNEKIIVNG